MNKPLKRPKSPWSPAWSPKAEQRSARAGREGPCRQLGTRGAAPPEASPSPDPLRGLHDRRSLVRAARQPCPPKPVQATGRRGEGGRSQSPARKVSFMLRPTRVRRLEITQWGCGLHPTAAGAAQRRQRSGPPQSPCPARTSAICHRGGRGRPAAAPALCVLTATWRREGMQQRTEGPFRLGPLTEPMVSPAPPFVPVCRQRWRGTNHLGGPGSSFPDFPDFAQLPRRMEASADEGRWPW